MIKEMFKRKEIVIKRIHDKNSVNRFLERYHYLGRVAGWRIAFGFYRKNNKHSFLSAEELVGVAVFGRPVARLEDQEETLELTRFCLLDDLPRNSESFLLSKCLKYLKKNTNFKRVISYSDVDVGHEGVIYKAVGFKFIGYSGGGNWLNRKNRRCNVGKHKKKKWEYILK